jgi:hypothetical protein
VAAEQLGAAARQQRRDPERDHRQRQAEGDRRQPRPDHHRPPIHRSEPQVHERAVLACVAERRRGEHERHDRHEHGEAEVRDHLDGRFERIVDLVGRADRPRHPGHRDADGDSASNRPRVTS